MDHGSPTPGPRTSSGPQPIRNGAAQQEVSGGRASEASRAAPHHSCYHLTLPLPPTVRGKTVFHETGPWCQKGWGPLTWRNYSEYHTIPRAGSALVATALLQHERTRSTVPCDFGSPEIAGNCRTAHIHSSITPLAPYS